MKSFRHGRRYNIRTGLKRGVVVTEGKDATELERQSAAVERRESINLPDRRYYEGWGTSTASAYVSGTAALIRSAYPRLSPAQIKAQGIKLREAPSGTGPFKLQRWDPGERITLKVSLAVAFAPANLVVRTTILADAENRAVQIVAESDDFYRSSELQLEGDKAARTKIRTQKKEIAEGTEEWDLLHRRYYAEELKKLGIDLAN